MKPFRDKIIAICLMRHGNEFIQSCKDIPAAWYRWRQSTANELPAVRIRFFLQQIRIPDAPLPKTHYLHGILRSLDKSHCGSNPVRHGTRCRRILFGCASFKPRLPPSPCAAVCRSSRNFILAAYFLAAVFRIEVSTVILDLLPHGRIRCKTISSIR